MNWRSFLAFFWFIFKVSIRNGNIFQEIFKLNSSCIRLAVSAFYIRSTRNRGKRVIPLVIFHVWLLFFLNFIFHFLKSFLNSFLCWNFLLFISFFFSYFFLFLYINSLILKFPSKITFQNIFTLGYFRGFFFDWI